MNQEITHEEKAKIENKTDIQLELLQHLSLDFLKLEMSEAHLMIEDKIQRIRNALEH